MARTPKGTPEWKAGRSPDGVDEEGTEEGGHPLANLPLRVKAGIPRRADSLLPHQLDRPAAGHGAISGSDYSGVDLDGDQVQGEERS